MDVKFGADLYKKYKLLWHLLFWLTFWVYKGLVYGTIDNDYEVRFASALIELPIKIVAAYFTLYVLIDKFLLKRRYSLFLGSLVASMIGFGLLQRILIYHTVNPIFYPEVLPSPVFYIPKLLITIFTIYSIVALVASFHLIKHAYNNLQVTRQLQQAAQALENEKLEAELKLLKSQVNPHFLFNTLNNLYVLTLSNSQKAPETVYKLSQLMSYMLYESNQQFVPLEKEVQYIENYLALEKIRYGKRLDVSLNVFGEITGIQIAPLLILPFVENCFKHGVSNQLEGGWIRIDLSMQEEQLVLKVENSKSNYLANAAIREGGIGLKNVKKRLELVYGENHSLNIHNEEDSYLVVLKIKLMPRLSLKKVPEAAVGASRHELNPLNTSL
ncbi:signal transduction histidine kinase [Flammeovirgaceae bacterium 311]|nr:signal transduction histidine kinase [Flammeovirgaceae bacterium 311]